MNRRYLSGSILLVIVLLISGCVQQQQPVTEVTIPGHPTYTFSNPIDEALKYPVGNEIEIVRSILKSKELNIVFNGSSAEDDAYFQAVLYNIVTKLQTFFVYQGSILRVQTFYFIGDQWYNLTSNTTAPDIEGLTIWIRGPNTGATENSIKLENSTIYIQGLTYKNLTLAGDRLVLAALGVQK